LAVLFAIFCRKNDEITKKVLGFFGKITKPRVRRWQAIFSKKTGHGRDCPLQKDIFLKRFKKTFQKQGKTFE